MENSWGHMRSVWYFCMCDNSQRFNSTWLMTVCLLKRREVAKNNNHDWAAISLVIQLIMENVQVGKRLIISVHLNRTSCFSPETLDQR